MITLILQSCELSPLAVLSGYQCFLLCFIAENGKLAVLVYLAINLLLYVTVSGKTGLIAHLKVSRNVGFKYSECCSWPMVVATHTKFSHVSQQFLTFLIIH